MAFIKSLFFFFAVLAVAFAIEGVREKKQVLIGAPLADDGSWFPGKYDPIAVHAAIPAAYPYAAYPYAYNGLYY